MKTLKLLLLFTAILFVSRTIISQERTSTHKQNIAEEIVLVCDSPNAKAYHAYQCSGLDKCTHEIIKIKLSEAQERGLKPCKICYK